MAKGLPQMAYHCPECKRVIFNRRKATCDFCGAPLPAELLFTKAEIEALDRELAEMRARRQKKDAEAEASRQVDIGFIDIPPAG